MTTVQPFTIPTGAARALSDLRRKCDTLFLGHRTEIEERLALAQHDDDPRIAERLFDDVEAKLAVHRDRVAAENVAWNCAPFYRRRIEAGHREMLVNRRGGSDFVPLCELTDAELAYFAGTDARISTLPPAAPEPSLPRGVRMV